MTQASEELLLSILRMREGVMCTARRMCEQIDDGDRDPDDLRIAQTLATLADVVGRLAAGLD